VRAFLANPHIADDRKRQVVERQLADIVDRDLLNLLKLLIDKRRTEFIVEIMAEYDNLTNDHRGVEDVRIVSAVPLSEDQRQRIVDEVRRFTSYGDLRVETEVDTGVLGGVKVFLGPNVVIDGTVSSQLYQMRSQLMRFEHRGVSA
jgi:F-type H+-transporting ATPase subunit delta